VSLARFPSYEEMANMLTLWKRSEEFNFLKNAPSQTLQQTLKDLYKAIYESFNPNNDLKFPNFRKKGKSTDSFRYPQGFKLSGNRMFLPKIGWVRFFKSREIVGKIKNITVKRKADGWYISIVTEQKSDKKHIPNNPVGIDVGVRKSITLSNGVFFSLPNFDKHISRIIKLERQLDGKQHPRYKNDPTPFSNNYRKYQKRLAKAHLKVKNTRYDFLHKITTAIAKRHNLVVVEDLKIKNITKSAKGTIENPGRNVKAKAALNKKILSQGWGIFYSLLAYKLVKNGGKLIKVVPHYTSQTCPICGCITRNNRKSQAVFKCERCGYENNADLVASFNLLVKAIGKENPFKTLPQGLREVKPVEYAWHTLKQEPAGNRKGLLLPV